MILERAGPSLHATRQLVEGIEQPIGKNGIMFRPGR